MTREAFLAELRANLKGVPLRTADEIVADYASHFDEGAAAGRSEADIAAALGDPARVARELRAEAGLKRWDEERSASAAAGAILAILSLGAIDLLILLPVLLVVVSLIFAAACVAAAFVAAGVAVTLTAPFGGNLLAQVLSGIGFLAAGLCIGSLVTLASLGLGNTLIKYGRFHVRLMKPAVS